MTKELLGVCFLAPSTAAELSLTLIDQMNAK